MSDEQAATAEKLTQLDVMYFPDAFYRIMGAMDDTMPLGVRISVIREPRDPQFTFRPPDTPQ